MLFGRVVRIDLQRESGNAERIAAGSVRRAVREQAGLDKGNI